MAGCTSLANDNQSKLMRVKSSPGRAPYALRYENTRSDTTMQAAMRPKFDADLIACGFAADRLAEPVVLNQVSRGVLDAGDDPYSGCGIVRDQVPVVDLVPGLVHPLLPLEWNAISKENDLHVSRPREAAALVRRELGRLP